MAKTITENSQSRISSLERENFLAMSYLDIAGVMIIVLNKKGAVKMVNKKTCDVLGYAKEEITGRNWFTNFLPPHIASKTQKRFRELMEGKEPDVFYENEILTKDKQKHLISWHTSITRDSDGNVDGVVSSGVDITESRRMQKELETQSRNSEFMYLLSRGISDTTSLSDLLNKAANILREYPDILGGKLYVFAGDGSTQLAEEMVFSKSVDLIEKDPHLSSHYYLYNLLESNINCVESTLIVDNGTEQKVYSCAYKMNTKYETQGVMVVFCKRIDATLNNFLMLVSAELGRATKRKKIELEIKQSEEKFTEIFNFIPDALSISGIDSSHFLEVNRGFEELTGFSRDAALNKSAIRLNTWVHPEERKQLIDKVLTEGKVKGFLTTLRKKDGDEFTAMFSAALLHLRGTKCMVTSVRDVSDQIKYQNEILSTKELLEQISLMSPLFISLYDVNHDKIIYLNKSFLQSLGYSKGDLDVIAEMNKGKDSNMYFYHPDDAARITEFIKSLKLLEEGKFAKIEFRLKDANNDWQWVQQTAAVFQKATTETPLLTINVFENISDRKAAEEKLLEQKRETELLYEAGKHISSTLDLDLIYDRMYSIISQVADCSELIVMQYDPKRQEILYKYLRGKSVDSRIDVSRIPPIPLAPKGFGIVSQVIRTGESVIIDDYMERFKKVKTTYVINQEGELTNDSQGTESPASAMVIPVKLENKIIGAVQIYSKRLAAYNQRQLRFVESLMYQVALANKNATVFEQAQHEIAERKAAQEQLRKSEKNLRQFAESVPDVLYRLDYEAMKYSFLSPVIETMLGYTVDEAASDPLGFIKNIVYDNDYNEARTNLLNYIKHGRVEAPLNLDCRVRSKDGRTVWVRNTIKFEYRAGNIHAVIGVVSDMTKEKEMEAQRRETDEKIIRHQSALLELSRLDSELKESFQKITENVASALKIHRASIWCFDGNENLIECKDTYVAAENSHHNSVTIKVENYPGLVKRLKLGNTIISGNTNRDESVKRFAKDVLFPHGTLYSLISPFRYKGAVAGSLCLESEDPDKSEWSPEEIDFAISATGFITLAMESHERKLAEEEIKKSLKDKEMLLREIHHRVKNNLQVISSMLFLQSKKSTDKAIIEGLIESQNRVKSMVMIHEKLYKSEDLASFDYSEYIRDLTSSLFRSYSLDTTRIALKLDVGEIMLDTDTAVHCGLIINELVSNSMKHAFPNNANGVITIRFNREGENNYVLEVSDDGIGIGDKEAAEGKGTLGMQLIHTLVDQLDGKIEVTNGKGTKFTIHFSIKNKS
jgi:PAS domain S-box-containing protein